MSNYWSKQFAALKASERAIARLQWWGALCLIASYSLLVVSLTALVWGFFMGEYK